MASSGVAPPAGAFLRERGRQASGESPRLSTPPLPRRRSSVLSFASDTRQSVRSSAGDFILPGLGISTDDHSDHDASHWHSIPLVFAVLPAAGGLLFSNGSAFVTDFLILGLACFFLNWALRLPWQWYRAAQGVVAQEAGPRKSIGSNLAQGGDGAVLDTSPSPKSRNDSTQSEEARARQYQQNEAPEEYDDDERKEAIETLRTHETLALLSTFIFPALGAYMLHVIRSQLSTGSTGLVSDTNLTIFLLAAEIKPCRQAIMLITNRTLHLQRIANGADHLVGKDTEMNAAVEARLEVLEAKVAEPTAGPVVPGKEVIAELSTDLRKRYESRIEGIERAIRRYEKRLTTLTILTDDRLNKLDSKVQDVLSLAAVAAQSSQQPSIVGATASYLGRIIMMPVEAACFMVMMPFRVVEDLAKRVLGTSSKVKKQRSSERHGKTPRSREKRALKDEVSAVPAP